MKNLKNENSFIYRTIVPIMQVFAVVLLLLALVFNNTIEDISDILRDISIAIQFFILTHIPFAVLKAQKVMKKVLLPIRL